MAGPYGNLPINKNFLLRGVPTNETPLYTVCVQIFVGHLFCEVPAPNNIHDINFANGGLQLQTCTICVLISANAR